MPADEMLNAFYIRMAVLDKPGSLGRIATILGEHGVSIAAAMQRQGPETPGSVPVVIVTDRAREADAKAAFADIQASGIVSEPPVFYRMLKD